MHPALFHYPKAAAFDRVLPKTKIYEHTKPSNALKDLFVKQVDKIIWQYKLAPETINLPAKPSAPEIQIFSILLKTPELNEDVLRCIDQAIPLPIFYQLSYDEHIKIKAAYKRPNEADASKWVTECYFETDWLAENTERQVLPVALDLAGLYEQLFKPLLPLPARPNEPLKLQVERLGLVRSKQNEYHRLESRLHKETQFNRKVELNKQLRALGSQLAALIH